MSNRSRGRARLVVYADLTYCGNITDGYASANYSEWRGTWQNPSNLRAYELCSSVQNRGL